MHIEIIVIIAICLAFTYVNGFHDGCNVVATIIASRSLSPKNAILIAVTAEFAGAVLLGTGVASTMANGIIKQEYLVRTNGPGALAVLICGVIGGITWNILTGWLKLPSSSSHALIGGLLGAGIGLYGLAGINWQTFLYKVVIVLFTSPLIGFITGYLLLKLIVDLTRNTHPRTNSILKKLQVISMAVLGMSHGSNDAQKTMGIISIALFLNGSASVFRVPVWVQLSCAFMIAAGLAAGGWRMIKTVGTGIFSVKPIHSLSSQLASSATIVTASIIGGPVSTSHVVNSSIMGVGSAERMNAVHWDNVKNIVISWILTIPASAAVAVILLFAARWIFHL